MDISDWNMTQWHVNIQEKSESKKQYFIFFLLCWITVSDMTL